MYIEYIWFYKELGGKRMRKKINIFLLICIFVILAAGCKLEKKNTTKKNYIDYTVVANKDIPEELKNIIDEKKEREFRITFSSNDYLYIVMGYGMRATTGYSVKLDELYETDNTININTSLIGPSQNDVVNQVVTYPYIVVKIEFRDKPTVFE